MDALKSLNHSNKKNELNQIDRIFTKQQLNDLIIYKLKKIKQLQSDNKLDDLEYAAKREKT